MASAGELDTTDAGPPDVPVTCPALFQGNSATAAQSEIHSGGGPSGSLFETTRILAAEDSVDSLRNDLNNRDHGAPPVTQMTGSSDISSR